MGKSLAITHFGKSFKVTLRASSNHYTMHGFKNERQLLSVDIYDCIQAKHLIMLKLKDSVGSQLTGWGVSKLITKKAYLDIVDNNKGPDYALNLHARLMAFFQSVD